MVPPSTCRIVSSLQPQELERKDSVSMVEVAGGGNATDSRNDKFGAFHLISGEIQSFVY